MDKGKSDSIPRYKPETEFLRGGVTHTGCVGGARDKGGKVKEEWDDCGELGSGGFGVVYKQIQRATGNYRAVKAIPKRQVSTLDCAREVFVIAKLAKHPSLFVKFLGWYEDPETMYIAMEYLEEGDLTRHTGAPLLQETVQNILKQILEGLEVMHRYGIAHRDIKPANIFVVSMSPVRVKLGDFGASKCINAPATTTLHTQVSTPLYGAPEILRLDANIESSDYTNSVDIWSLGCVIYELLVGENLFGSAHQVSCYLFHRQPFLEKKLERLPTPADDAGTSLLKSMLSIEPGDRPTAAEALKNAWLIGLKSGGECRGGDEGGTTQSLNERTSSRERKPGLAPDKKSKKRSPRDPPTQDDTRCAPGDLGSAVNQESQIGSKSATLKAMIDISVITQSDAASAEGSASHLGYQKSGPVSHDIQTSYSKDPNAEGKNQAYDIPPTSSRYCPQAIYQNLNSAGEIVSNLPQGQMAWQSTARGGRIGPRGEPLALSTEETMGVGMAPPLIHYAILTPGETLILAAVLAGVLMVAGILSKILRLTGISIGILVLLKILATILSLAKILIWGESKSQSGRQARTEFPLRNSNVDQAKETLIATEVEDV